MVLEQKFQKGIFEEIQGNPTQNGLLKKPTKLQCTKSLKYQFSENVFSPKSIIFHIQTYSMKIFCKKSIFLVQVNTNEDFC